MYSFSTCYYLKQCTEGDLLLDLESNVLRSYQPFIMLLTAPGLTHGQNHVPSTCLALVLLCSGLNLTFDPVDQWWSLSPTLLPGPALSAGQSASQPISVCR